MSAIARIAAEVVADARAHPTRWRLLAVSACAALGSALPDIIVYMDAVL